MAGISGGGTTTVGSLFTNSCQTVTVLSETVTVTDPSKLYVISAGLYSPNGQPDVHQAVFTVQLKSGGTVVGRLQSAQVDSPDTAVTYVASGIIGTPADVTVPVTLSPGTYTLEVNAQTTGLCDGSEHGFISQPTLTHLSVGP